jgi:hypothetical protein
MTLDQIREELAKRLDSAREGSKAVDPVARAFSMGHAEGFRESLQLIDKALQADQTARNKAAAQGKGGLR